MKRYIKADIVDIGEESYGAKYEIARSRTTRDSTLAHLIDNPDIDFHTLEAIATNPNASFGTIKAALKKLDTGDFDRNSHGAYYDVVEYLSISNHNPEVLEYLSTDPMWVHPGVRKRVATNPATSEALLCKLAEDEDSLIRYAVCCNYDLPLDLLRNLREDKNVMVQRIADKYYYLRTGEGTT